jgi:hypothetical protein
MRITGARIGVPTRHPASHGDLWSTAWLPDGDLVTASDDTQGFDQACSSNLAISVLRGDDPLALDGETINAMGEYGLWGVSLPEDFAFWKANGIASVDGVLYLTVSRHSGYIDSGTPYQEAFDASIVKSTDGGLTWSAAPALGRSMFPGPSFATPYFVDHGQDMGAAPDDFVYAVSTDGWNNGSSMRLGRVLRSRIGRLDAADWEFLQDFDHEGDGAAVWGPRHDTARAIFRAPGRTSMTGIHRVEPLGLYVMPQWHYTHLGEPGGDWSRTQWDLYQAPAPWGPWELFHSHRWEPEGFYNPFVVSKFTSDDGRRLWLFTAGDFTGCMDLSSYYGLFVVPVDLEVDPDSELRTGPPEHLVVEREQMLALKEFAVSVRDEDRDLTTGPRIE